MYAAEVSNFSLWWLFPLVMIVLCFLMMRGRKGSMMCGFGSGDGDVARGDVQGKRLRRVDHHGENRRGLHLGALGVLDLHIYG